MLFYPLRDFSRYVYDLAPFYFLGLSLLLYGIAFLTKDLKSQKNILLRLVGSPIKLIAFLLVVYLAFILFYLIAWTNLKGYTHVWILLVAVGLYLINDFFSKKRVGVKAYWSVQIIVVIMVFGAVKLIALKQDAKTIYVIPESAKDEVIILFGIEGYPELPKTTMWKKNILIPDNGLLVTSSMMDELPGYRRNYIKPDGQGISLNNLFVQEYCALESDRLIISAYLTPKFYYPTIPTGLSDIQNTYQQYYDSICSGQLISKYKDTRDPEHKGKLRSEWLKVFQESRVHK
ncbi:hypothetical protein DNU06_06855 [Putridiphycobacter roseus]|uniref:Uncharacterized protein n=2 Tax=Putridiphycobacter roseus TaxID=2219161 RepID=A0A2W1N3D7_9FLAO|nr:hypothetical protein DNU06_06855 [Putridiphycobacter roseus]